MYIYIYIYTYRCRNLTHFSYCIFILIYLIYVYNLCSDEPDTNCCRGCASENQTEKTQLRGSGVRGWLGGWVGGWMGGWVGGWLGACIPYFTLSPLPYVSRMAPHASIVRPSGSPHVPCVSPAGPPYVPACSLRALRVFLASPACPPVCSRMFPRVPRMFPA